MIVWRKALLATLVVSFIALLSGAVRVEAKAVPLQVKLKRAQLQLQDLRAQLAEAQVALKAALVALEQQRNAPPQPAPQPTPASNSSTTGNTGRANDYRAADPAAIMSAPPAEQVVYWRQRITVLKPQIARVQKNIKRWRWALAHPMNQVNGSWLPVVKAAARRHHLNAGSLYRMMNLESGGRAYARGGGGLFLGLFQYWPPTWRGAWNPYRSYSIFNGGAQIWATAVAISRGWGPRMWPVTYRMAFGYR